MSTETNLGKIHVFPSEESYQTNATNVGDSDLALVPINPIVSLSVNGDGNIVWTKLDGSTGILVI